MKWVPFACPFDVAIVRLVMLEAIGKVDLEMCLGSTVLSVAKARMAISAANTAVVNENRDVDC